MTQLHRRVALIAVLAAAVLLTLAAPVARARVASPWDAVEGGVSPEMPMIWATPFFISEAERSNTLKVMRAFAAAMPSLGWSGADFCTWAGVRCFDTNVSFIATGSLATGTLPEMPDDVDYSLVKLDQVDLSQSTGITGTLPSSWSKLHKVRTVNLGYTSISSTLPASWSSMSSLRFLTLSSTDVFGTLPAAWSSMSAIEQIVISSTQITGTLPEEWSTMPNVRRIHFQQCNLYGSFPASWARMPSLERLGLQNNNFCGCVPDSWLTPQRPSPSPAAPARPGGVRLVELEHRHDRGPTPSSSGSAGEVSGSSSSSTATTAEPTTSTTSPTPCPTPCRVPNCMSCAPGNSMRCSVCFPGYHSTLEGVALPLDAAMPDYEQGATRAPDSFTPVQCLNTLRATRAFAAATPSLRWAGGDVCSRTGVPCWISALGPASIGIAAAGSLPGMPDDVACSNAVIAAGSSWSPGAMSSSTLPCRWCLLQYVAVVYLCRARVGGARLASWSWMGSAAAWAMQATAVNRTLPNVSMLQLPSGKLHCRYPASWPQVRPVAPIASRGSSLCGCAPQPGMDAQTVHFGPPELYTIILVFWHTCCALSAHAASCPSEPGHWRLMSSRRPEMPEGAASDSVYSFGEVNRRLWLLRSNSLPKGSACDDALVDWAAIRGLLEEAPEERSGVLSRYLLRWLNPYVMLAWRERLEEAYMPPPQRAHRAVCCGALLSRAFREEEVRGGRDAWRARVEAALPVQCGACDDPSGESEVIGGDYNGRWGGARVAAINELSRVRFRGEEGVHGRLRWVGYVRSSDTPHTLLCGVEWDADSALPPYRARVAGDAAEEVVHDGCVQGERLFYQVQDGRARCTCEYVQDLVPVSTIGIADTGCPRMPHAPSLLWALLRTFRSDLMAILPPSIAGMICEVSTPWLLQQFVLFLQSSKERAGARKGLLFFSILVIVKLVQPALMNKEMHRSRRVSSLFRTSTLALIFEKCLTISPDALSRPDMNTGRVLAMASSDVENIKEFPTRVMFLWMAPTMLTLYVAYLFVLNLSSCTDQRLRRTNELLSGIRVVKMMGWESKFVSAIEDNARADELRFRRRLQMRQVGLWACVFSTPTFMIAAVLTTYTLSGHKLDASVVFPLIAVVSAITFPVMMLPEAFTSLAKFIVSTGRVTQFLECDDSHIIVEHAERMLNSTGSGGAASGDAPLPSAASADLARVLVSVPAALPVYEPRHVGLRRVAQRILCAVLRRRVPVELQWRRAAASPAMGEGGRKPARVAVGNDDGGVAVVGGENGRGSDSGVALYAMVDRALLRDVRVSFPRAQLTVVVGATGSGKSVLLATLLGAFRFEGHVSVAKSVAYVPQQPWIMQETLEANITFFEGDRRGAAGGAAVDSNSGSAQACQLNADVALMARGLGTEIGERGINLSGGQKARVSLARAVYADRDVYLLDDPLSALDAHVGRRVMDEVVLRALAGKTRVLATHQLQVLPHADQVVVMREGCAVFAGSYAAYAASEWKAYVESEEAAAASKKSGCGGGDTVAECTEASSAWSSAVNVESCVGTREERDHARCGGADGCASKDGGEWGENDGSPLPRMHWQGSWASENSEAEGCNNRDSTVCKGVRLASRSKAAPRTAKGSSGLATGEDAADGGDLMTAEEKETGHTPWSVYRAYFEAGGGVPVAIQIVLRYFVSEALSTGSSVWLTLWSVNYFGSSLSTNEQLGVYLGLVFVVAVTVSANDLFIFQFARRAACRLHAILLYTVSSATLTFFDRTPLGRIVNRFSRDVHVLDDELPANVIPFLGITGYVMTSLAVTLYTSPLSVVVVLLAAYAFVRLLKFYATVVREVRRRSSVGQSPLLSLLEEVVHGRATIAAYDKSHVLFAEALLRLDLVYSCTYVEKVMTLWLAIRIEYIASLAVIAVGLIGVVEKLVEASPALPEARVGLISLSLTMCLDLSWSLSALLDLAAAVEASMNSVQRVCHYIDHVPQEAALLEPRDAYVARAVAASGGSRRGGGESSRSASDIVVAAGGDDDEAAPARQGVAARSGAFGALRLEHVDLRYRPGLPLVLRDVCFTIAPGQKVGVVGRTGSGKSTLLLAFLRLVEVSGGRMLVCGRDARTYTLPALRRLFSMIPQDPVLFDGTVRSNVDPFGDATDEEVRAALVSVGFVGVGGSSATFPTASGLPSAASDSMPALDTVVQGGGSNFSVGQRQLLCLARALLKKGSAFILMDEATANVDAQLDQTVQRIVAEQFGAYTVVTIAHRLHTVAAYDVVLVMARGRVVEMGQPRALLERRDSVFYGMVAQSAAVADSREGLSREDAEGAASGARSRGVSDGGAELGAAGREHRVEAAVASLLRQCK
ncbi:ABC transporter family protein [Leishmania donovani]|uniref:ABC transporter family protein n=1 Tax=Leishmania donovani TaxID=5661 RepID=A0A504WZY4_LEIDO|nr:ABC transporter family protein [Leishmania donovani]